MGETNMFSEISSMEMGMGRSEMCPLLSWCALGVHMPACMVSWACLRLGLHYPQQGGSVN